MRNRCVALVTRDAGMYAEIAPALRERRIPTVSLLPGQRLPSSVAIVLTTAEEVGAISHRRIVAVPPETDRSALWTEIGAALSASDSDDLVVGIDPGPRPGFAVLANGRPLSDGVLDSPEAVGRFASQLRRRFPERGLRFRVGSGDRLDRDRIVHSLLPVRRPIELVNESGTTPRGVRHHRDPLAARAIAATPGLAVRDAPTLVTTPGEVQNLQRLSREGSGGRFTIPRHVAERVLKGELTLSEAIDDRAQRDRSRGTPAPDRRTRDPLPS